jgi:hypothetical protein
MEREKIIDKIKQLFGFIKIYDKHFFFTIKIYNENYRMSPTIKALTNNKIDINIKNEHSNFNIKIQDNSINSSSIKIKDTTISGETIRIDSMVFKLKDKDFIKGYEFGLERGYIQSITIMKKAEFMKNKTKILNIKLLLKNNLLIRKINRIKYNLNPVDGTFLMKRLPIKRGKQFIVWTKELQLNIWKQIIEYTRKRPTELEIIGIFSKIPIKIAHNIKINHIKRELLFSIRTKNDKLYKHGNDVVIVKGKTDEKIYIIPLTVEEKNENSR